jgi:hypothetical protein
MIGDKKRTRGTDTHWPENGIIIVICPDVEWTGRQNKQKPKEKCKWETPDKWTHQGGTASRTTHA